MRKKYLSALLFGALLVTSAGTFTSCKDYDDEINNLQEQVDKLATKEDMEAKLSQMQAAIDAAKATAEEALAKAESIEGGVDNSEEVAKLTERVAALEEAMKKVETLKEEIKSMVDGQLAEFRVEMEEFMKEVEELTGYSLTMITGVSFIYETGESSPALDLKYARIEEIVKSDGVGNNTPLGDSYEFGKGLTGSFIVKKGDVNTVADNMLIKVDPVDAIISSNMLSLINGKGEDVNSYITYNCEAWSGDLTTPTRSNSNTGLYSVSVKLNNDVDFEAFDKLVLPLGESHENPSGECDGNHEYNLFALSVADSEKSRAVTSDYKVTMHVTKEEVAENIAGKTTIGSSALSVNHHETIWEYKDGEDHTSATDEGCCPIVLGEEYTVTVGSEGGKVMASYISVDYNNIDLSASDLSAIKNMTFTGVDNVIKDSKHVISVNGTYAAGVAVPLKLTTIDYTGVVKENIFWVKASTPALMASNFVMTPKANVASPTAWSINNNIAETDYQEFKIPATATKYSISLVVGETENGCQGKNFSTSELSDLTNKNINSVLKLFNANKIEVSTIGSETNNKAVAYAAFVGTLNLQAMREDKVYSGEIKFYDAKGTYLGANTINVSKVLPTSVPSDFTAKTNAINNGVLTVYPKPGSRVVGTFELKNSFNNWENNFEITISGTDKVTYSPGENKGDKSTAALNLLDKSIISNDVAYASSIQYNYGAIKFIPQGHGVDPTAYEHKVAWGTEFSTKFNCWPVDCEYSWYTEPEVYYKKATTIEGIVLNEKGEATADRADFLKVKSPYGETVNAFSNLDENLWSPWAAPLNTGNNTTIKLITNGDKVNEFFTAEYEVVSNKTALKLSPTSTDVVLSGDVETTVVFVITDKFGHTHEVSALTFTMKKDQK